MVVAHARHVRGSAKMKVTSATQLRQILRRGLTKVLNDDEWPSDSEIEEKQLAAQLDQSLNRISKIYNSLKTNEAKEGFERRLLESVQAHVNKWQEDRQGE